MSRRTPESISPEMFEFLTSPDPDLTRFTEEETSESAVRDWVEKIVPAFEELIGTCPGNFSEYVGRRSFPVDGREITLACINPTASVVFKDYNPPFLEQVTASIENDIGTKRPLLRFRTNAWKNQETGNLIWLAADSEGSMLEGRRVNSFIVRCVEAMLIAGRNYYSDPDRFDRFM